MPASEPLVRIEPLKPATQPELYTEDDLAHPPVHREQHPAADPQGPAPGSVETLACSDRWV